MTWTSEELQTIGDADELQIASAREDGTLRPFVIIWAVRVGDELYLRSAHGPTNGWYRRALASGTGRIRAGGLERDATFTEAPDDAHDAVDAAYHAKYGHYDKSIVNPVTDALSRTATIRVVPR